MSDFKYADEYISDREIMIAIPSTIVAVSILTLPRYLADVTIGIDAWISILIGGIIVILITWMTTKVAVKFPRTSFKTYASRLATKPVAYSIILLFVIYGIVTTAFEVRAISEISHQYLFDRTPMEVISLAFLLVVVYAVSGSRAGLFRLHALFFPIISVATLFVIVVSIIFVDAENMVPRFQTDLSGYVQSIQRSILSISGFGVIGMLLFYISNVKNPKKVPKKASLAVLWITFMYLSIFLTCIAVFGNATTANLIFPTIELSRAIELPGGFFNRFETFFFIVWTMAIFNTSTMTFDIAIIALQNIFPKVKKIKIVFILAPIILLISSLPKNFTEVGRAGEYISYYGFILTVVVTSLLMVLSKIKGVK